MTLKKIKVELKNFKVLIPGKKFNLIKQGQNFGVSHTAKGWGGNDFRGSHEPGLRTARLKIL